MGIYTRKFCGRKYNRLGWYTVFFPIFHKFCNRDRIFDYVETVFEMGKVDKLLNLLKKNTDARAL